MIKIFKSPWFVSKDATVFVKKKNKLNVNQDIMLPHDFISKIFLSVIWIQYFPIRSVPVK